MSELIPLNLWTYYNPEYKDIINFAKTIECPESKHEVEDISREFGEYNAYMSRSHSGIRCSIRDKNGTYLGNVDWDPTSNHGTFYYSNESRKIEICICFNQKTSGIVISVAFDFNKWNWDISNQECSEIVLSFLSTHCSFTKMVEDPEFMFQVEMMKANK